MSPPKRAASGRTTNSAARRTRTPSASPRATAASLTTKRSAPDGRPSDDRTQTSRTTGRGAANSSAAVSGRAKRHERPQIDLAPEGVTMLDREICYRALRARDARFDGVFYTAVVSTGIYCRPVCPARTPMLKNCVFLPSAAAAHQMGFRPCLRCRPEIAPGLAGWRGSANTVSRALSLIAQGRFDEDGAEQLAARLGVGARHLRRLFDRYVGATPVAVAQAHRVLFAKQLITETTLSMAEIALAAGFQSIRRFNDAFVKTYHRPPSAVRRTQATGQASPHLTLKLGFSPPYDFAAMLEFLGERAIPGVELVRDGGYHRTFSIGEAKGRLEVRSVPGANYLLARIQTSDVSALSGIVARLRQVFDLDADSSAIDELLAEDRRLRDRVLARPGLRVPGSWDSLEVALRAVLGQQISVRAATTFAGRIVRAHGQPLGDVDREQPPLLFPTAEAIAAADFTQIGLTRARSATLNALAAAIVREPQLLNAKEQLEETVEHLCRLPGVGPWTAHYIAMRGLREPDAFPATDLGVLRALATEAGRPSPKRAAEIAEAWRPWRAYATLRLWLQPLAAKPEVLAEAEIGPAGPNVRPRAPRVRVPLKRAAEAVP